MKIVNSHFYEIEEDKEKEVEAKKVEEKKDKNPVHRLCRDCTRSCKQKADVNLVTCAFRKSIYLLT